MELHITMSTTYGAVEVTRPGLLKLVQRTVQEPGPGEVRLRVEACGVCHSDSAAGDGIFPDVSYALVTILIDERPDGTHLSYDRMASFLEAYGNEDALNVARELDAKIETLLA